MTLLDRIKTLCDAKGETLASLERQLHFGNGTIRRWGEAIPSGDKLTKVADYFHVSVDYLLGRIDNPWSMKFICPESQSLPKQNNGSYRCLTKDLISNSIDALGRDGTHIQRTLSDEQFAAIKAILNQLPDASDDL